MSGAPITAQARREERRSTWAVFLHALLAPTGTVSQAEAARLTGAGLTKVAQWCSPEHPSQMPVSDVEALPETARIAIVERILGPGYRVSRVEGENGVVGWPECTHQNAGACVDCERRAAQKDARGLRADLVEAERARADLVEAVRLLVEERDALAARLDEREGDMHARIRAEYDRTIADTWRAANARIADERDEARAQLAALHEARSRLLALFDADSDEDPLRDDLHRELAGLRDAAFDHAVEAYTRRVQAEALESAAGALDPVDGNSLECDEREGVPDWLRARAAEMRGGR